MITDSIDMCVCVCVCVLLQENQTYNDNKQCAKIPK